MYFFLDVIKIVLDEAQTSDHLDTLEEQLNIALTLLERDFPISLQVLFTICALCVLELYRLLQNITTHILHHIVKGVKDFGPVYAILMYPFERFNS